MIAFSHPAWLLIGAVFAVGVLHTLVPDHWVPISVIARQQRWTSLQTSRAAIGAGIGHTFSTLAIGIVIWIAGVAFALRFGHFVSLVSSIALIAFGGWIAIASLLELRTRELGHHGDRGDHYHHHDNSQLPSRATNSRVALMLILGSSPMIEGIPAFFAAAKFGAGLLIAMSAVFAASTIATYAIVCVYSAKALRRMTLGPFERYGEVISGGLVAGVGVVFLIWPI